MLYDSMLAEKIFYPEIQCHPKLFHIPLAELKVLRFPADPSTTSIIRVEINLANMIYPGESLKNIYQAATSNIVAYYRAQKV